MGPQKMNLECRKMLSVQDSTVTDQRTYGHQVHLLQLIFWGEAGHGSTNCKNFLSLSCFINCCYV